jgi:hypothetical protein
MFYNYVLTYMLLLEIIMCEIQNENAYIFCYNIVCHHMKWWLEY